MRLVTTGVVELATRVPIIPSRRNEMGRARVAHYDPRSAAGCAFAELANELYPVIEHGDGSGVDLPPTIAVTSATRRQGRTLCAANLAIALAAAGRHVLLVDADVRNPLQRAVFHEIDDAACAVGAAAILPTDIHGLDLHPPRSRLRLTTCVEPTELEALRRCDALRFEQGGYDHIVIDAPPMNELRLAEGVTGRRSAELLLLQISDHPVHSPPAVLHGVQHRVLRNRCAARVAAGGGFASRFWVR